MSEVYCFDCKHHFRGMCCIDEKCVRRLPLGVWIYEGRVDCKLKNAIGDCVEYKRKHAILAFLDKCGGCDGIAREALTDEQRESI